jgi:hypothetical protein
METDAKAQVENDLAWKLIKQNLEPTINAQIQGLFDLKLGYLNELQFAKAAIDDGNDLANPIAILCMSQAIYAERLIHELRRM